TASRVSDTDQVRRFYPLRRPSLGGLLPHTRSCSGFAAGLNVREHLSRLTTLKWSTGSRTKGRVFAICGDLVRGRLPSANAHFPRSFAFTIQCSEFFWI